MSRPTDLLPTCAMATRVSSGQIKSKHPASSWHARCAGAAVGVEGVVRTCACRCHGSVPDGSRPGRCVECGATGVDTDNDRCVDDTACADRIAAAIAPTVADHPKQRRDALCAHCGEPTRGGTFLPGHDAKLKGELLQAGRAGSADAIAEFMVRGWWKDEKTHKIDVDVAKQAVAVVLDLGDQTDRWMDAREEARRG